jgi:hypothetical protein
MDCKIKYYLNLQVTKHIKIGKMTKHKKNKNRKIDPWRGDPGWTRPAVWNMGHLGFKLGLRYNDWSAFGLFFLQSAGPLAVFGW